MLRALKRMKHCNRGNHRLATCFKLIYIFIFFLTFFGCIQISEENSNTSNIRDSLNGSIPQHNLYDDTNSSLPLKKESYYFYFEDSLPTDLQKQVVYDCDIAYRLALSIQNYLPYITNNLDEFNDINPIDNSLALQIAIHHVTPIDLRGTYTIKDGFFSENYPSHPIVKKLHEMYESGLDPTNVFYKDDVDIMLNKLFGAREWVHQTTAFYHYCSNEEIYIQMGDISGLRTAYPQLIHIEETQEGYYCEAILLSCLPLEKLSMDDLFANENETLYGFSFALNSESELFLNELTVKALNQVTQNPIEDYMLNESGK